VNPVNSSPPDDPPEPTGIVLDTPDPPDDLPYADFEDYRARELLGVNGIEPNRDSVLAALRHGEPVLQGAAAHTAAALGLTEAIPDLKHLVETSDDLVKTEAGYGLVRLGLDEYRQILKEALRSRPDANLSPAVAAGDLARLGDPSGFPVLATCFEVDNLIVRMIACKQLLFFVPFHDTKTSDGQRIDVYDLFKRASADPHPDVRLLAARQLSELETPEALRLLHAG
jgi:HEAT repeat protein